MADLGLNNDNDELVNATALSEANNELTSKTSKNTMLRSLEMMAMQRVSKNTLDVSTFSSEQRDKLLNIMDKNEDNAYKYTTKKLEVYEKINLKAIDATCIDQKTLRYILLYGGLGLFILMVLILILKDEFFVTFLSFVTGLVGGIGLKGVFDKFTQKPQHIISDEADDEL
jgi:hypothetical protein